MNVYQKPMGDAVLLILEGSLDAANVPPCEAIFREVVEKHPRQVILEGSRLEFVSEMGLRALFSFSKQMRAIAGELSLVKPSPLVRQIFGISGLSACIPFYETVEEAQKLRTEQSSLASA
ncbi:MAG: STAS domain-containing protein [Opitutales bacterium]|nr:STAS domain-containing protein [Opitutales bacterium]